MSGNNNTLQRLKNPSNETSRSPHTLSSLWKSYRGWAFRNEHLVSLVDDLVQRLLYWLPAGTATVASDKPWHDQEYSLWREVAWALLQWHRMMVQLATTTKPQELYGTTVSITDRKNTSIIVIRFVLSMLPTLSPILQHVVGRETKPLLGVNPALRLQHWIERVRFLLKIYVLVEYWRDTFRSQRLLQAKDNDPERDSTPLGIMSRGGALFSSHPATLTVAEEESLLRRVRYVGRRTGRTLEGSRQWSFVAHAPKKYLGINEDLWRISLVMLGEILYVGRPLLTSHIDVEWFERHADLPRDRTTSSCRNKLLLAFAMDAVSLICLRSAVGTHNDATRSELDRRKLRLMLYLLRSPLWDQSIYTRLSELSAERSRVVTMLCNYLWEYLHYWRVFGEE